MPPHLNNKRSTALFGIPLTALVGVSGLAVYWYLEQPQRQVVADTDDVKHLEEGTEETSERERLLAQRRRTLIKTRERLRRGLDSVGFFHNFGAVCASAVAFELACAATVIGKKGKAYEFLRGHTTPFKLLVAYVATNHVLYGVHTVLGTGKCPEANDAAGVGGMLNSVRISTGAKMGGEGGEGVFKKQRKTKNSDVFVPSGP